MSGDSIWSVVAVVGVLFLVIGGWQFAAVEGATDTAYTDSTTVTPGETYELEASGEQYTIVSITTDGGTTLEPGEDFEANVYRGTVTWTDSALATDVTIEYDAAQQDATTSQIDDQLSIFQIVLGLSFFGVCASVFLGQLGRWL